MKAGLPPSSSAGEASLTVEELHFAWPGGKTALRNCNLRIPHPGFWMLVGSNGSGKSTLLRLIAGLLQPCGGRILTSLRPAMVFQNPDHQLLLPSCGSDLQLGMPEGLPRVERKRRCGEALHRVGLVGLEDRPIHTLSGGQKQRLAIAGALAGDASLLLLDEPTALLDPISQQEVILLVRGLCSRLDQPLVALWVTHRLEELDHCDWALRMEDGAAGEWCDGPSLRRGLTPLPAGRIKR